MPRKKKSDSSNSYGVPPQTELDCRRLQEEFLKPNCPKKIKDDYFMLLRVYARSLALKEIKRKNIFLPPERVDEICTDAVILTMNQYQKNPGWKIEASFAGMLRWKIVEAMYKPAKEERNFSLNTTFSDDQDSKEILDLIGSNAMLPWGVTMDDEENSIIGDDFLSKFDVSYEVIEELINDAYKMLPYPTFLRLLPWLLMKIRKPRTRNVIQLFEKMYLTTKERNAFDLLLLEMHNRLKVHAG